MQPPAPRRPILRRCIPLFRRAGLVAGYDGPQPEKGRTAMRHRTRIQATAVARAGWACLLLLVPKRLLAAGSHPPVPAPAVALARVLGARQLLQSAATAVAPTARVAGLGAAVDALHVGTDVGLAAVSPRWRRVALIDALVGAGLAAAE